MQARRLKTEIHNPLGNDRALVALRTQLEAKLLAYRCGWQAADDIRVKKLELALKAVLAELGRSDPAEALIRKTSPGIPLHARKDQIRRSSSGSGLAI